MSVIIKGGASSNLADVNAANQLKIAPEIDVTTNPGNVGGVKIFSENDDGLVIGSPSLKSPETDDDYRLRAAQETILEQETFNYTAQNTGKHLYRNTTMTIAWTANGLQTNSGSITTINTGVNFQSLAYYPLHGIASTYIKTSASFSTATPVTNTNIDFGMFLNNTSTPYAPTDGVYFRYNSAGLFGVINFNGTEVLTSAFTTDGTTPWVPSAGTKYGFLIVVTEAYVEFWINNQLVGEIQVPVAQGQPFQSASLPYSIRHAIGGVAASTVLQFLVSDVIISIGGPNIADRLSVIGNRILGSYQGLSGGSMGSLASYGNSSGPTAAAGSNTAANVAGLGGQGAINAAATANTDFIMTSYLVPAGTVAVQGRRLVVRGCKISCANLGAAVATTATTCAFSIAFGHNAVSLATTETAGSQTKAPRRIAMGFMYWPVGAPIGATPQNGDLYMNFDSPIYVNPSEYIATVMKFVVGTATASQAIHYHVTFDYGWE